METNGFSCILCGCSMYETIQKGVRDSSDIDVIKCNSCNHIQLYPLPTIEEEKEYYNKDMQMKALISEIDEKIITRNIPWIEQQIERYSPYIFRSKMLLEIGSGYGTFLAELKKRWSKSAEGIEVSAARRCFAEKYENIKLYGLNLMIDEIPVNMRNKYDLIVSFHVLEHISNPNLFIKKVRDLLCEEGMVIFEVPNVEESFSEECKAYEQFKWLRAHISYFSAKTLYELMKKNGFLDIKIKGVQNYSIENHLHWMRTGKPNLETIQVKHTENLEWINKIYKETLEKVMKSDAIMVIGKK
jgi:SAM-dependent methyltransferase